MILWVLTRFIVPALAPVMGMDWINVWITKLDIDIFIGYLGYFILGYYIRQFGVVKKIRLAIYAAGCLGLVFSIINTIEQSRIQGKNVENYFNPSSWMILIFSTAIFVFFCEFKENRW